MTKAKILIVEDERIIAAGIKHAVKSMGFEIAAETDTGEEAIKLAGELKPDLVLMDILLKGKTDGIEASKKIYELYRIPVVFLTAHEDDMISERAGKTKSYGYVLKPYEDRDLNAVIRIALSQHESEKKLEESEERYFRLAENARDVIFRISLPEGRYEYVNRASEEITGYTPSEFYENPLLIRKFIHPDWKQYLEVQWQKLLEGDVPPVYEFQIIHKSGEVRWLNQRNVLVTDEKKRPVALEGIVTDITEQKKAEATIRKQHEEYRHIFDSVPAMIWYKDDNNKMLRVNKLAAKVKGCTVEEMEGRYTEEHYPEEAEKYLKDDLEVVRTGKPKLGIIEKIETGSGEKIWVKTDKFPYRDEKGNIIGVLVFAQDITAQKRIEEELLRIERMNSIIFHTIPEMMFQLDKNGRFADFRVKNKSELIFLPPMFLNKKTDEVLPEEIARKFNKHIELAFKTYEPQVFEYKMKIKDELHEYECRMAVSGDNEVLAIIREVTENKRTYRELQESEEKYRKLTQLAPIAITRLLTKERIYELVNDEFVRQSGYTLDEFNNLPSEEISRLIYPEDRQRAYEEFDKWMKDGYVGVCNIVYRIINKYGRLLWLNSYHYADFDSSGKLLAVNQIYIDISELKNSEEALRSSEAKFRTVAEISPVAIYILQGNKYVYGNPYVEKLTGYRIKELLKMDFWEILHPDYREAARERGLARQRGEDVPESYEAKIVTKSGQEKWIYVHATAFEYEGKPAVLGTTLDITERKKAEEAIRDSEEKFRAVAEAMPAQIIIYQGPKFMYVNPFSEKLTGFTKDELLGMNFWDNVHPEYKELIKERGFARLSGKELPNRYEMKIRTKSGEDKWIDYSAAVIQYNGKPAVLGMSLDITEMKRADEKIKQSLQEKEVLLKEVHHRVKNNLQIITSLLKLQSGYIKNEMALEMFKETQNRVQSMSLVHQKLYQSKDLGRIDLNDYIKTLISHLVQSFGIRTDRISVKLDVENVFMPIDLAIPCGLIINELITNSMKHAFEDRERGEIYLRITHENGIYNLFVSDNGVGLPPNFDIKKSPSFGLKLVNTLANQIKAKFQSTTINGTEFEFEFSASERPDPFESAP